MTYVKYDEMGASEVRCMKCLDTIVAIRDVKEINGKNVPYLRKNSSWHQKVVYLKNKGRDTYVEPILCSECIKEEIDKKELIKQIKLGISELLRSQHRSEEDIEKTITANYNLTEE